MSKFLTRTSVLALSSLAFGGLAHAQSCDPAAPGEGATVICAGADTTGLNTASNSLDITVSEGASVTTTGTTMEITGTGHSLLNQGTIRSTSGRAILSGGNLQLRNEGTIDSVSGIWVNGDADVVNASGARISGTSGVTLGASGALSLLNEEGAVIDDPSGSGPIMSLGAADIENHGTISAGNNMLMSLGANSSLYNGSTGVISSTSVTSNPHFMMGPDSTVTNDGLISTPNTRYTMMFMGAGTLNNTGTIQSGFVGVHASGPLTLTNTGTMTSTGEVLPFLSSALTLVSGGTIANAGLIENAGAGGGAINVSGGATEITNTGRISGNSAVVVQGYGDTTIINHGTLIGTGGTALQFGSGDDTLVLYSLDIRGDVVFGTGDDTLIVGEGAEAGILTFGSDLETVDTSANKAAIFADDTLVVADAGVLGSLDASRAWGGLLLGRQLTSDFGSGWWGEMGLDVQDDASQGTLTLGRDFANVGVFLSATRGTTEGAQGLNEATRDRVLVGLRGGFALGASKLTGALYVGKGDTTFSAVGSGLDFGSADDTVLGLALGVETTFANGLGLAARAGVEQHDTDAYSLTSLGGATFGARKMTASHLDVEASYSIEVAGGFVARPFIGASVIKIGGDANSMSFGGETVHFDGLADDTLTTVNVGAEFAASEGWSGRLEARLGEEGELAGGFGIGLHF